MNYEKKYKEALGWMQSLYNGLHGKTKEEAEKYFPELKESEDERIREALVRFHKSTIDVDGIKGEDIIAWLEKQGEKKAIMNVPTREVILSIWDLGNEWKELTNGSISTKYGTQLDYIQKHWHESEYYLREKQGEQKVPINDFKAKNWYVSEVDGKIHDMTYNPADKIEPKFHEGDWIVDNCNNVWQVVEVSNNFYRLKNINEFESLPKIKWVNETFHLWSVKDAKDGDVLYSLDSKQPFIFKHRKPNEQAAVYCGINTYGKFFIGNTKDCVITTDKYIPADKSQRDILFKEMHQAGYEWLEETHELKEIEQKPTWSEADERIVTALMEGFRYHQLFNPRFGEVPNAEIISWIKSLKERLS